MQKLNYCDKDISVFLVRGKEAPRSILEASESMFEPDRRASKRSRKTRSFVNLKVSASTSIYQLKMMIWESLGVSYIDCIYEYICNLIFSIHYKILNSLKVLHSI